MNEKFKITADTYVLKLKDEKSKSQSIINIKNNSIYTIPVYQRSYSWESKQVIRLIRDIFESFRGVEGDKESEPMFIGTMQLKPEYSPKDDKTIHIIDGQQRLTTLLILLKVLKLKYPDCKELKGIEFNWLATEVSGGEQQEYLDELVSLEKNGLSGFTEEADKSKTKEIKNLNHYIKNAVVVNQELNKQINEAKEEQKDGAEVQEFNVNNFVEYLFTQVHFVVIKTTAGLSKTLKIFDAINTTGMDLNTGDIFKIRMYEYLKTKDKDNNGAGHKDRDKEIFKNISELYEKIDCCNKTYNNKTYNKEVTSIQKILRTYQFYLIGKYKLPNPLYDFATDTFYERLFETIFKINNSWPNFQKIVKKECKLELDLEVINGLIDARFQRHEIWLTASAKEKMYQYLWNWSRYSNRKILMDIYLYECGENGFVKFVEDIVKTFLEYSLWYDKVINDIRRKFTHKVICSILNEETLKRKQLGEGKKGLCNRLNGEIFHLTTAKNILCRLSASLEVLDKCNGSDCISKNDIKKCEIDYIFTEKMDIEHIQSHTDEKEKTVPKGWQGEINKFGNLVLLERNINRSVSNETDKKLELNNKNGYPSSKLTIVNSQVLNLVKNGKDWGWNPTQAEQRKCDEIEKVWNFLYPKDLTCQCNKTLENKQ